MSRSAIIHDTEHANVQGIYYYLDIPPLSFQQEQFVLLIFRGMSVSASAKAVGMSASTGAKLLDKENVQKLLNYMREQMFQDTRITLETLNSMTLEAHRKSISSTEELNAVGTLAKLNMIGGYAPKSVVDARVEASKRQEREHDVTPNSMGQLEQLEEARLLRMANLSEMGDLDPTPKKIKVKASEFDDDAWPDSLDHLAEVDLDEVEIIDDE